jgi:hypothetical protein
MKAGFPFSIMVRISSLFSYVATLHFNFPLIQVLNLEKIEATTWDFSNVLFLPSPKHIHNVHFTGSIYHSCVSVGPGIENS